jgi:hypothetical protein
MSIQNIIEKRGIQEILHFTTNKGITGILATKSLKSRVLLSEIQYLEHIYQYNCPDRSRDKDWWGYVNLSITSINTHLFGISTGRWHAKEDGWWCILSFSPEICCHEGVLFTTTNNMYSGAKRTPGAKGLEKMFDPTIVQWSGQTICRQTCIEENKPTCEQAEVLYPKELSLKYLTKVYVRDDETAAKYESIAQLLFPDWWRVPCEIHERFFE